MIVIFIFLLFVFRSAVIILEILMDML